MLQNMCVRCKATVTTIIRKEGREAESNGLQIATPRKVKRTPHNKIICDDMDKDIIRRVSKILRGVQRNTHPAKITYFLQNGNKLQG